MKARKRKEGHHEATGGKLIVLLIGRNTTTDYYGRKIHY